MRRGRTSAAALAAAALLAAGAAPPEGEPAPPSLAFTRTDTLRADARGAWPLEFVLRNPGPRALVLDSLWLEVRDGDAGETRAGRVTRRDLARLAPPLPAPGDSSVARIPMLGTCERGEIALEWSGHDSSGTVHRLRASRPVGPGPLSDAHPSRRLLAGGRAVETVAFAPPAASAPAPGVLLVHGHGSHARSMLRMGARLSAMGWGVVLVSQPGYGLSEGPADFMGPATLAALEAALAELRALPGVDGGRLAAWGVSRGATAALLLAARRPEGLRAVVAQGGLYDVASWLGPEPWTGARANLVAEAGRDSAAWRERSPLAAAGEVRAAVLLVHGRRDEASPFGQARAMAAALARAGAPVDTLFVEGGHLLPKGPVDLGAEEFLKRAFAR